MSRNRRVAAFLFGAVALQVSPVIAQVFRISDIPMVIGWRMYHGKARDVCEVHFDAIESGAASVITVPDLLTPGVIADPNRYIVRTSDQAKDLGRRRCTSLAADADLRLFMRCANPQGGWTTVATGEENLCAK